MKIYELDAETIESCRIDEQMAQEEAKQADINQFFTNLCLRLELEGLSIAQIVQGFENGCDLAWGAFDEF